MIANNVNKKVIGLTGGIASGKSAAAEIFADAGAYIIDTDTVSREVSDRYEIKREIAKRFPEATSDGKLSRRKLRAVVFGDEAKRKELESILQPVIRRETERLVSEHAVGLVVLVVPLLFESGFDALTDYDVTVSCPRETRINRLVARDNISKRLAESMIDAQFTDAEREARADVAIDNSGTFAELRAQVLRLYHELK